MTNNPPPARPRFSLPEQLSFLLTNRIPRRYATIFMGWFSKIQNPIIRSLSIALWRLFSSELDLGEAKKQSFSSLQDCFIRQLKPGMRTVNQQPEIIISPCDAIVGAHGYLQGTQLFQTKGFPYQLEELLPDPDLVERYRNGVYITLRLKATMYHRFHAPCDCRVENVNYISGDTWNVNPVTLQRIEKLYTKNERAVIDLLLDNPQQHITLVPVAAILVAGIKLHCLPEVLDLRYRGPNRLSCAAEYRRGDEMGYFQHGSTIIVFANQAFRIHDSVKTGARIQMGNPLLTRDSNTS